MKYEIEEYSQENYSYNHLESLLGSGKLGGMILAYYEDFDSLMPNAVDYINTRMFGDYEYAYNCL